MRKLGFLVLGVMAAASGCSTEGDEPEAPLPTVGVTQQQLDAFDSLKASSHKSWKWVQHDDLKTPLHLSTRRTGDITLRPSEDIKVRTLEVLEANKALFKMRSPGLELSASRAELDEYGMQHARFQQVSHGVPVVGAELSAHYDDEGHLASIDANYISDLEDVDVNPRFAAAEALAMVKADILGRMTIAEGDLVPDAGKLVIYAQPGVTRLAYEYRVRALKSAHPAIWIITVDAHTGDILHRINNFQTIAAQGTGVLGDTKSFEAANAQTGGFVMSAAEPTTQIQLQTFSAKGLEDAPGSIVTSTSATAWDTTTKTGKGAAVDAHYNAGVVAKYYKTTHNRNSIDGVGGPLQSTVHYGQALDNAAWIGTGMIYGDGGDMFKALSVGLDVVGHEFTHGVTEKTSALAYENQSGALNEAVSDIFGAFIEHSVAPDPTKNWLLGEQVSKDGTALRNMMDPNNVSIQQPAHMLQFVVTQQDAGGVHINSGIINNAAWLMTVGGTNPVSSVTVKFGIGWEKSEKLWYQANTKYFMSTTNFAQAAVGVQSAGKDIGLSDNELAIVDCAFKATGVINGACSDTIVKPQGSATSTSSSGDATSTDDDDDAGAKPKKKTKKKTVTTTEPGCNAGGRSNGSDRSTDFGALLPFLGVAAAIGLGRRRRR